MMENRNQSNAVDDTENATASRARLASRWRRPALDLVFPPNCPLCESALPRTANSPCLCSECCEQITTTVDDLCQSCGRERKQTLHDGRCPGCREERYQFSAVVCLGPYRGALSEGIVRMKHAGQQSLTEALARQLAHRLRAEPSVAATCRDIDVLVPIPMHWRRRILRGAGTSLVLAESLAAQLGLPVTRRLMRCTRPTEKQSTLSTTARKQNVRGAFSVTDVANVTGLHIGLVDDTITTGATANEVAKALLSAGADRVTLLALARAVSKY